MKITVIDGQGGKLGAAFCERARDRLIGSDITAVGTNAIATATMLKAGAHRGATGENAVIVAARSASIIIGPVGIIAPDALLGEVTAAMAAAIGASDAKKLLLPVSRCGIEVIGLQEMSINAYIEKAIDRVLELSQGSQPPSAD